jgi:hypothetical protein
VRSGFSNAVPRSMPGTAIRQRALSDALIGHERTPDITLLQRPVAQARWCALRSRTHVVAEPAAAGAAHAEHTFTSGYRDRLLSRDERAQAGMIAAGWLGLIVRAVHDPLCVALVAARFRRLARALADILGHPAASVGRIGESVLVGIAAALGPCCKHKRALRSRAQAWPDSRCAPRHANHATHEGYADRDTANLRWLRSRTSPINLRPKPSRGQLAERRRARSNDLGVSRCLLFKRRTRSAHEELKGNRGPDAFLASSEPRQAFWHAHTRAPWQRNGQRGV